MARPRKPTKVLEFTKAFAKNPSRGRARAGEPVENGPLGDPPARLSPSQKEVWLEMMAELVPGVALASDRTSWEGLVMLETKRRYEGGLVGPEWSIWKQLHSLFGKTPSDRSRVSAPKGAPGKSNAFTKLG